ncbi:RidA family protein [Siccirubricoccus sp. G192]|uniref:RidA family protein n=1 Tax=Siccirubricoccus sp. G192 TaxID=2849651 RepID=UPI001C2BA67F|nr:RidA family protein [Siccirubricoccus sp. G192]MBV1799554.1 RidA family protein [Siccirubricoccus sp. G192]
MNDTPSKPAFSPARVVPLPGGAKLIFCSGVTARGSAAEAEGVEAQAAECFARLGRALAAEGASLQDLLKVNTWLADMRDYAGFDAARRHAFAELATPPASTCVGGAQSTTTASRIEIEGVAVWSPKT